MEGKSELGINQGRDYYKSVGREIAERSGRQAIELGDVTLDRIQAAESAHLNRPAFASDEEYNDAVDGIIEGWNAAIEEIRSERRK